MYKPNRHNPNHLVLKDFEILQKLAVDYKNNYANKRFFFIYNDNDVLKEAEVQFWPAHFFHLVGLEPRFDDISLTTMFNMLVEDYSLNEGKKKMDFISSLKPNLFNFTEPDRGRENFTNKTKVAKQIFKKLDFFENICISKIHGVEYYLGKKDYNLGIRQDSSDQYKSPCSIRKQEQNLISKKGYILPILAIYKKQYLHEKADIVFVNKEIDNHQKNILFAGVDNFSSLRKIPKKIKLKISSMAAENTQINENNKRINVVEAYIKNLRKNGQEEDLLAVKKLWLDSDKSLSLKEIKRELEKLAEDKIEFEDMHDLQDEVIMNAFSNYIFSFNNCSVYGDTNLVESQLKSIIAKYDIDKNNYYQFSFRENGNSLRMLVFCNNNFIEDVLLDAPTTKNKTFEEAKSVARSKSSKNFEYRNNER